MHSDINSALIEWSNKFSNGTIRYTRHNDWDINQDISIKEIKEAILATPNYKASGPDGIPTDDENSVNNSASGLNCLQKIYSRIWNGEFPSSWNEASIISIPKKGDDLSDYDNYRGISLINNGIKLISKIVSKRISEYGLKNNFIRSEQFGFRNKEESVSLFISIREICQRRKNDNKDTYLAFLDLKKAYDSVPIGNILYKLDALGIRGKYYQFIKNLYSMKIEPLDNISLCSRESLSEHHTIYFTDATFLFYLIKNFFGINNLNLNHHTIINLKFSLFFH